MSYFKNQSYEKGQSTRWLIIAIIALLLLGFIIWSAITTNLNSNDLTNNDSINNNQFNDHNDVNNTDITSIEVTDNSITDQKGNVILSNNDVPTNIQTPNGEEFGVAGSFTDASLSPDRNWVAFTTMGVAHGTGWTYEIQTEEITAVAFQFGGTVVLKDWSNDSQHIAFFIETPGPEDSIKIVNINELQEFAAEIGFGITFPTEEEHTSITEARWERGKFCFTVEDSRYCINPETEDLIEQNNS